MVCDFAETYGVLDYKSLPIVTAATLAQGLPDTARIKRKISGAGAADTQTALLAIIADRLGHIAWMFSEAGQQGRDKPASILDTLMGRTEPEAEGFDSAEEFCAAWEAAGGEN